MSDNDAVDPPSGVSEQDVVKGRADPEDLAAITSTLGGVPAHAVPPTVVTSVHAWRQRRRDALATRRAVR